MKALQPSLRSQLPFRPPPAPRIPRRTSARSFITAPTQTLTASRTLPYPSAAIYAIIADVPSYSSFLPYCTRSLVTRWSNPDRDGRKWPEEAHLAVGWRGIEESFTSKIYCVPGRIVEAVGGSAKTRLRPEDIRHHTHAPDARDEPSSAPSAFPASLNPFAAAAAASSSSSSSTQGAPPGSDILTHLMTRWTVRPFPYKPPPVGQAPGQATGAAPGGVENPPQKEHTEVTLAIEFQFANPVYSAMSAAVSDKVAGVMIEAFERRVRQVLEGGVDGLREEGRADVLSRGSP